MCTARALGANLYLDDSFSTKFSTTSSTYTVVIYCSIHTVQCVYTVASLRDGRRGLVFSKRGTKFSNLSYIYAVWDEITRFSVARILLFRPTQLKLDGILTCTYPNTTTVVYLFWCTRVLNLVPLPLQLCNFLNVKIFALLLVALRA